MPDLTPDERVEALEDLEHRASAIEALAVAADMRGDPEVAVEHRKYAFNLKAVIARVRELEAATAWRPDVVWDALAAAYEQGCYDIHWNHEPDQNPEFGEAAQDYAASVMPAPNAPEPVNEGGV